MGVPVRNFIENKMTSKGKRNRNKRVWNLGCYCGTYGYVGGFKHCGYYDMIFGMLIASILVNVLGILVFLFLFWKRLKDDYASEIVFKTAFFVLVGALIGFLLSLQFMRPAFFWAMILGGSIGLGFSILTVKIKFYESFEALVLSSLPWLGFVFLSDSVIRSSLNSFLAFLAMLIFSFIFYYMDLHYKTYTWYKSGRIGFSGLTTLILFFVTRSLLAIFKINMISFLSLRTEISLSAGAAIICLVLLINLANGKK